MASVGIKGVSQRFGVVDIYTYCRKIVSSDPLSATFWAGCVRRQRLHNPEKVKTTQLPHCPEGPKTATFNGLTAHGVMETDE